MHPGTPPSPLEEALRSDPPAQEHDAALTELEAVVTRITDGLVVADAEGNLLAMNPAALRLHEYDDVEAAQRHVSAYAETFALYTLIGDPVPVEAWPLSRALRGERFEGVEVEVRRRDTGTTWIGSYSGTPVYDEQGRLRRAVLTIRDITRRLEAERALRQSEALLQALVDQMPSGVSVAEAPSGRLLLHNGEAVRLLRHPLLPSDDLAGYARYGALHEDDTPYAPEAYPIARALFGEVVRQEEMRYRRGDGTLTTLAVNAAPVRNQRGEIVAAVSTFHDVSAQKRAEETLRRAKATAEAADRTKSDFLAAMSHELRTPLTAIMGFADLLGLKIAPEHEKYAQLIRKSGQRLLHTINSVLELTRLQAGEAPLAAESFDLGGFVRETLQLMTPLAQQKGLVLEAAVPDHAPPVQLSRSALDRILTNLLSNAIKFTETGGVTVHAGVHACVDQHEHWNAHRHEQSAPGEMEAPAGTVWVRVEDTGIGIEPAFVPHLFEEFRQAAAGRAQRQEGSGLGLAITKRLVDLMGGRIEVTSEPGRGSTFTVTLPQRLPAGQATPGGAERAVAQRAPARKTEVRRRVLVLEDHDATRRLVEKVLGEFYDVDATADGEAALHLAEAATYDVVLLDIQISGGADGEEILRRMRTLPAYRKTPVLAFTAYAMPGDRERFLEAGFDSYVSKPFTLEGLVEALEETLSAPPPFGRSA